MMLCSETLRDEALVDKTGIDPRWLKLAEERSVAFWADVHEIAKTMSPEPTARHVELAIGRLRRRAAGGLVGADNQDRA